jgi:nicotinamidase-related amidase
MNNKISILLVIDMQNDFIEMALGSPQAQAIVGKVCEKMKQYAVEGIAFTRDTHSDDYMKTQEGKNLPVPHCIQGSKGWQINDNILKTFEEMGIVDDEYFRIDNIDDSVKDKPVFGDINLPDWIKDSWGSIPDEITLVGLCTSICILSNAMILKAAFPETIITVDAECCACVSEESHRAALLAMKTAQVNVINE